MDGGEVRSDRWRCGGRACPRAQTDRPGGAEAAADRAPGQYEFGALPVRNEAAGLGGREPAAGDRPANSSPTCGKSTAGDSRPPQGVTRPACPPWHHRAGCGACPWRAGSRWERGRHSGPHAGSHGCRAVEKLTVLDQPPGRHRRRPPTRRRPRPAGHRQPQRLQGVGTVRCESRRRPDHQGRRLPTSPSRRMLSRDRTRCPRCPASRCTTRCRHRQAAVARASRRARPDVRTRPRAWRGALHPRARCRPARQDAADS